MNQYGFSNGEIETAIAAAAYAVTSLEEREGLERQRQREKQRRSVEISGASLPKTRSKMEESRINLTSFRGTFKRLFTDQEAKDIDKPSVSGDKSATEQQLIQEDPNGSKHSITEERLIQEGSTDSKHNITEQQLNREDANDSKNGITEQQLNQEDANNSKNSITVKEKDINPKVKKAPTYTDKHLNETGGKRVDGGKEARPGPKSPPITRMPTSPFVRRNQDEYSTEPSRAAEKAAAWEKTQMIKIKNRYDKMMAMILEWENEKKEKARSHLEKKQNEPEHRRARALQTYQDEISRIEKVAGEARALTEEKKRNDEAKARAKAQKIRSTGRIPRTCGCL